jgi:hypothetical protein
MTTVVLEPATPVAGATEAIETIPEFAEGRETMAASTRTAAQAIAAK